MNTRRSSRLIVEEERLREALAASEERLQATLLDLEEARREANAARDRSLALLVHELRGPLTPTLLMAEILEGDPSLSPGHRETAATIRRNIELEARLVEDLLDVARIAHGKLAINLTKTDAEQKLHEVLAGFDGQLREKGLNLLLRLHASDHCVHADPLRLRQVLWNLIHNSFKFTPKEGLITVRSENSGSHQLVVEVADTGIGIETDLLPRIFDPFEQGSRDVTRKYGGLGLGLSICKSLVEAQGGALSVRSEGQGKGAVFRLQLPLAAAPGRSNGFPDEAIR